MNSVPHASQVSPLSPASDSRSCRRLGKASQPAEPLTLPVPAGGSAFALRVSLREGLHRNQQRVQYSGRRPGPGWRMGINSAYTISSAWIKQLGSFLFGPHPQGRVLHVLLPRLLGEVLCACVHMWVWRDVCKIMHRQAYSIWSHMDLCH